MLAAGVCPQCGSVSGTSFVSTAEAPPDVQTEARAVARVRKEAEAKLRRFRNAAMVLLYVEFAPKLRRDRAFRWHEPTIAKLSRCFGLSERRVRELLETADAGEAMDAIERMRRKRHIPRWQGPVGGIDFALLPPS